MATTSHESFENNVLILWELLDQIKRHTDASYSILVLDVKFGSLNFTENYGEGTE